MPESASPDIVKSTNPIDTAVPVQYKKETIEFKSPWWKRPFERLSTARIINRINHGKEPLTKRQMERSSRKIVAWSYRIDRAFDNAPSLIEGLTFAQTLEQIHAKYPDGIKGLQGGLQVPFKDDVYIPLSPAQEIYVQRVAKQQGMDSRGIYFLRSRIERTNYMDWYYEKYGDKSLKPDTKKTP